MIKYTKEQKAERLKEIRDRQRAAHERARKILQEIGFTIKKDIGPVSNKPWDFIAKKYGLTYYIDAKSPYTAKDRSKLALMK